MKIGCLHTCLKFSIFFILIFKAPNLPEFEAEPLNVSCFLKSYFDQPGDLTVAIIIKIAKHNNVISRIDITLIFSQCFIVEMIHCDDPIEYLKIISSYLSCFVLRKKLNSIFLQNFLSLYVDIFTFLP